MDVNCWYEKREQNLYASKFEKALIGRPDATLNISSIFTISVVKENYGHKKRVSSTKINLLAAQSGKTFGMNQ